MFSGNVIRQMQLEAAADAAQKRKTPYVPWPEDFDGNGDFMPGEVNIPFLGDYEPPGWERLDASMLWRDNDSAFLFVDISGFGGPNEPAMTLREFARHVRDLMNRDDGEYGLGLYEVGQVQGHVAVYRRVDA